MKKQTAMFLSFSALLTIGAMSPNVLWHANKISFRAPASFQPKEDKENIVEMTMKALAQKDEQPKDKMETLLDNLTDDTKKKEEEKKEAEAKAPLKELEHKEAAIESREVKLVKVEAQVSCLKEQQPKDLEADIKKLMEDKEKIMKELEELKAATKVAKKEDKPEEKKDEKKEEIKDDKKDKKLAKTDYNEDIVGIMSQLSSLMISQQQQSMAMMTQMFSMFQAQQPKQQSSWYSPMSDYMSPYAFNASQYNFPNNKSIYSLDYGIGHKVGLGYNYGYHSSPYSYSDYSDTRVPAQEANYGSMFEVSYISSEDSFQPQTLVARPHNGFDFRQGTDAMSMQRIQMK